MTLSASEWALSVNLIPLVPRNKMPLKGMEWTKYQSEFSWNERTAWKKEWPDMNYGLVTGSISGVDVIDFDKEEGKALFEKYQVAGTAPVCETARGYHAYYSIPDEPIGNATGIVLGLDFRGEGGYVLIPPSVHPSGKKYRWIDPPWRFRPAPPLPGWFWPLWNEKKAAEARERLTSPPAAAVSIASFDDFAREHGCEVPAGGWIADGRIHRCDAYGPDGKLGRGDGSYKVHPDPPINGSSQANVYETRKAVLWVHRSRNLTPLYCGRRARPATPTQTCEWCIPPVPHGIPRRGNHTSRIDAVAARNF